MTDLIRRPVGAPLDARPLTEPVSRADVAAFTREMKRRFPAPERGVSYYLMLGVLIFGGCVPLLWAATVIFASAVDTGNTSLLWVAGLTAAMFGLLTTTILRGVFPSIRRRTEAYRIARFAAANGLEYLNRVDNPPLPGWIFRSGINKRATNVVRVARPKEIEIGNYQYTEPRGESSVTQAWGYVTARIDTPLRDLRLLDVTGDFTARGADAYGIRALFTPAVLARLATPRGKLDVEVADGRLFLYTSSPASTAEPATWTHLFDMVDVVSSTLERWTPRDR